MFWTIKGAEEFEKMFKRQPFVNIDQSKVSQEGINAALRKAMESATFHFGEGGMNPSTIACVFYLVEEEFLQKPPATSSQDSTSERGKQH
jgi:hypothetical protein